MNIIGFEISVTTLNNGSNAYAWDADKVHLISQVRTLGGARRDISYRPKPGLDVDLQQNFRSIDRDDINVTLVTTDVMYQRYIVLTANRTITLPSTNLYDGLTFTIAKVTAAPFTLTVVDPSSGHNITLPAGSKGNVTYRATSNANWDIVSYFILP